MHKIPAVALVIVGLALMLAGVQRRGSLAGASESAGQRIATRLDGAPRFPTHSLYLGTGIVCVIIGGVTIARRQIF